MKITNRLGIFLLTSSFGALWTCTQPSTTSPSKRSNNASNVSAGVNKQANALSAENTPSTSSTSTSTSPKTPKSPGGDVRHDTVSAFNLDDDRFLILDFTVGLETYLNSQTPVLNYSPVLDVDYVEIMRCPVNAVIAGASATLNLKEMELSAGTLTDRENMYRHNDFWSSAVLAGCTQLTTGTMSLAFYDSWAPNGSYRYLIRSCINPQRLTDIDKLTSRNCSRQIAVTIPLSDYVNTRAQAEMEYLRKANEASGRLLTTLVAAKQQADSYACFLQWCECGASEQSICARDAKGVPAPCTGGIYGTVVAKTKKDAIVTLVSVGFDLALNAATSGPKGGLTAIAQSGKGVMGAFGGAGTVLGYGASLSGMSFSMMFQALAAQTQDFPKSCAKGISNDVQMSKIAQAVEAAQAEYNYYGCRALAAKSMTSAAAGDSASSVDFSACPTSIDAPPSPQEAVPSSDTSTGG